MYLSPALFTDPESRIIYAIFTPPDPSVQRDQFVGYVGECPAKEFFRLGDAARQPRVFDLLKNEDALKAGLRVEILATAFSEEQAFNFRTFFTKALRPAMPYVFKPRKSGRPKYPIRCIETGYEYESAAEAAKELGIAQSNLSMHLNGTLKTCGGYTFERIME